MLEKKPFVKYNEGQDEEGKVFSVRLNKQEMEWLEEIKEDLDIKQDGKALKVSAFIGKNVLQSLFGRKFLRYLFKKEREKLSDIKSF